MAPCVTSWTLLTHHRSCTWPTSHLWGCGSGLQAKRVLGDVCLHSDATAFAVCPADMVHTIADPLRQDCPWQSNVLASMMGCGCGAAFTHVTRLPCSFHMCDAAAVRLPCVRCRSPIGPVWPSGEHAQQLHGIEEWCSTARHTAWPGGYALQIAGTDSWHGSCHLLCCCCCCCFWPYPVWSRG